MHNTHTHTHTHTHTDSLTLFFIIEIEKVKLPFLPKRTSVVHPRRVFVTDSAGPALVIVILQHD